MTRTTITLAGRVYAVRFAMWSVANDGGKIIISVDLLATP